MADWDEEIKNKADNADDKFNELKGRTKQKMSDMDEEDTAI